MKRLLNEENGLNIERKLEIDNNHYKLHLLKQIDKNINLIQKENRIPRSIDKNSQKKFTNSKIDNSKEEKKPKILGRKRKNSNETGEHNKYSQDNIIRKIKTIVLSYLLIFINKFINNIYKGNIGKGKKIKELKKMNPEQIKILGNKKFLYKNLKDIFSEHISTKYTSLDLDHNKILIEKLINEKDSDKKIKFEKLFSLTFVDCLNHIIKNHII